jgi:hypothetical protein
MKFDEDGYLTDFADSDCMVHQLRKNKDGTYSMEVRINIYLPDGMANGSVVRRVRVQRDEMF